MRRLYYDLVMTYKLGSIVLACIETFSETFFESSAYNNSHAKLALFIYSSSEKGVMIFATNS